MRAVVLKPFGYSANGITAVPLAVGWEGEIRDDLAPGLIKERFIRPADVRDDSTPPAIPPEPVAPVAPADEGVPAPRRPGRPKKLQNLPAELPPIYTTDV